MNELASKLFKTFFRSKKSFLSSELEFVEVSSKMENFRKFPDPRHGSMHLWPLLANRVQTCFSAPKKFQPTFCAQFADHLDTAAGLYI